MYGGLGKYIQGRSGANVRESNRLYVLSIDGRMIFKCILREQDGRVWTGSVAYPGILFGGGGSTNSVEDRGQ